MTISETQDSEGSSGEQKHPARLQNSCGNLDKALLVFGILICFGDGVETYLPGVVSQKISCEMKLSSVWGSTLECIQYFTMALAVLTSGPLAKKFGCRRGTLLSLYTSVFSSVACAVVPSSTILILSRAFIGIAVGLNYSVHSTLIGKLASRKSILDDILLISDLMYSLGGVWSAVLGFLLLEVMGWRTFILVTSLPLFIPPIVLLHCYFQEETRSGIQEEQEQIIAKETPATVPNYAARVIKLALFRAIVCFLGWLTILLVPSLIRMFKVKDANSNSDCSLTATRGPELLLLGLVTSASLLGRVFIHYARKRLSFRKRQVLVALMNVGCFVVMLLQQNLGVAVTTNVIVKFLFGIGNMESVYMSYDESYFGTEKFTVGSSIVGAVGIVGAVVGLALVAYTTPFYVMIFASVVGASQIPLVLSWTEVHN